MDEFYNLVRTAAENATIWDNHGRSFIMIELSKTYIDEIGIPRIERHTKQRRLFK